MNVVDVDCSVLDTEVDAEDDDSEEESIADVKVLKVVEGVLTVVEEPSEELLKLVPKITIPAEKDSGV